MTMKVTGRKASLYATAMAVSLAALSGAAYAGTTSGSFAKYNATSNPNGWRIGSTPVTKEAAIKGTTDTRTAAQKAADAALQAKKTAAVNSVVVTTAVSSAITAYETAVTNSENAIADAPLKAADVTKKLAASDAAAASAAAILAQKQAADAKVATAQAAFNSADAAKTAADLAVSTAGANVTTAQTAEATAAAAAKTSAQTALNIATAAANNLATSYGTATVGSTPGTGALLAAEQAASAYQQAVVDLGTANALVVSTGALVVSTNTALNAQLASPALAAALANVNAAEGTSFTATYEGMTALAAYDDDIDVAVLNVIQASNGYNRATASLTAAAGSANENIALASGALTNSAGALAVGANFETEVLSVLVNHEDRITTNTAGIAANKTAIAALDVRTTANTTAISALDVRTTANTTAIANEVTARVAADNALGARITAETDARIAADNVLRDQIASSTATAIAMGGAALLPDMGFTLSGNIAVYEGAQAMALNAAAKVGANAYVTAAVGGGLNKNGSVGGRVGFVFGF